MQNEGQPATRDKKGAAVADGVDDASVNLTLGHRRTPSSTTSRTHPGRADEVE